MEDHTNQQVSLICHAETLLQTHGYVSLTPYILGDDFLDLNHTVTGMFFLPTPALRVIFKDDRLHLIGDFSFKIKGNSHLLHLLALSES